MTTIITFLAGALIAFNNWITPTHLVLGATSLTLANDIGRQAFATCQGVKTSMTTADYDQLNKPGGQLPVVNGKQCENAYEVQLFDTPSGNLDLGYYTQDVNGKYRALMQITIKGSTSTDKTYSGFVIQDTIPLQNSVTVTPN